jgi:hypothetical protein
VSPERVVTTYLKTIPVVQEMQARVGAETPSTQGLPWVEVVTIADPSTDGGITDRHREVSLQIACYAGKTSNTRARAEDLYVAVREALRVMNRATLPDAVVSGAESFGYPNPDTDAQEPPLQRWICQSTVWMRPR